MSDNFKDYRKESRKNWGSSLGDGLGKDQINTGCLLRIADSLEKIEIPYLQLIKDLEFYKNAYKREKEHRERAERSIIGLKSVITRFRNTINSLKE